MDVTSARLHQAIEAADLRVLLMCLFHQTADHRWLEAPYLPARDVRLVADPHAGLSLDIQREIRDAACEVFAGGTAPLLADPGNETMLTMMEACLGERVSPEYSALMREELGFISRDIGLEPIVSTLGQSTDRDLNVVIVGAGVSGIALAAQLQRLGVRYTVLEKSAEVGGTWWDNRYPGCGVDTPNHAYSYSHGTRARWTRYFSLRDEIENYLVRCATEFGIREHIVFGATVTEATYDETTCRWRIEAMLADDTKCTYDTAIFVPAVGVLNIPSTPNIAGIGEFCGEIFHTARWPDNANVAGKRVAVVGTGASAMQLVPTIAPEVGALSVFQRSPQWARKIDGYRSDIGDESQWLFEHVPYYLEWFRFTMWWRYGDGLLRFLRRDPEWPHPERSMNRINDRHRQEMTDFLFHELGDREDLKAQCLPSYPPYGKRILIDNGWFQALRRDNVSLVTDPIERISATGVITADGTERDFDAIVLATGFQTKQMAANLNVTGVGGKRLDEQWANDDPRAYMGLSVPGFPNMFCMLGPNTGLGHGGSTIFMSECQARYISTCLQAMATSSITSLEVRTDVHDDYNERVDAEHGELIWTHPAMTNWYRNAAGRVTVLLPWRLVDYWSMTHDVDLDDYRITRS